MTPEVTGDVGSPNRSLREGIGGSVIVRTGRRVQGVDASGPRGAPRSWSSAWPWAMHYGADEEPDRRSPSSLERAGLGGAERIEPLRLPLGGRVSRFLTAAQFGSLRLRRAEVDRVDGLRRHAQGGDGCRGFAIPASRHRVSPDPHRCGLRYGQIAESSASALVVPSLNPRRRLPFPDLVAGAPSVRLREPSRSSWRSISQAPSAGCHGRGAARHGALADGQKLLANPMAMLLACAAVLDHAAHGRSQVSEKGGCASDGPPSDAPRPAGRSHVRPRPEKRRPPRWWMRCYVGSGAAPTETLSAAATPAQAPPWSSSSGPLSLSCVPPSWAELVADVRPPAPQ